MNNFKRYIPSRNTSLFGAFVLGLVGIKQYDSFVIENSRRKQFEQCDEIAKQPFGVTEIPRKVIVYLPNSKYAASWWEEYVKPFFDRAALDYEIHPLSISKVAEDNRERMWKAKKYYLKLSQKKEKSKGWLWNDTASTADPSTNLPMMNLPEYDPDVGIVAIGPMTWKGALFGLKQGVETEKMDERDSGDKSTDTPPMLFQQSGIIKLPVVGYIHAKELQGFESFPRRMLNYFHERDDALKAAKAAMDVVLDNRRHFLPADTSLGSEHFVATQFDASDGEDFQESVRIVEKFDSIGQLGDFLQVYGS